MARLIAAKCPNCGAGVRIDLERELATCDFCGTSSFVQTTQRRATEAIRQQHPMVIDVDAATPRTSWILAGIGLGVVALAAVAWASRGAGAAPPPPTNPPPEALPAPPAPALPPLEPTAAVTADKPTITLSPEDLAALQRGASVRGGAATISGRLDPSVVHRVVRTRKPRLEACYVQGLARMPEVRGRLTLRFVIGASGELSNVEVSDAGPFDAGMKACATSALSGLSFPKPASGLVTVQYPFQFDTR